MKCSSTAVELRHGASSGSALRASELVVPRSTRRRRRRLLAMEQSKSTRPVVVEYPLGAGRVLFSGAMDAWRYRASPDDGFGRFWRTRIAEAALAAPGRLEVSLVPECRSRATMSIVRRRVRATEWLETSAGTRMPASSRTSFTLTAARTTKSDAGVPAVADHGARSFSREDHGAQGGAVRPLGSAVRAAPLLMRCCRCPRCAKSVQAEGRGVEALTAHRLRSQEASLSRERSRTARAALPRTPQLAGRTAGASGAHDVLSFRVRGSRERRMGDAPAPQA